MSIFLISDCIFKKEIKLLYIPVLRTDTLWDLPYWVLWALDPSCVGPPRLCLCVCLRLCHYAVRHNGRAIMGASFMSVLQSCLNLTHVISKRSSPDAVPYGTASDDVEFNHHHRSTLVHIFDFFFRYSFT